MGRREARRAPAILGALGSGLGLLAVGCPPAEPAPRATPPPPPPAAASPPGSGVETTPAAPAPTAAPTRLRRTVTRDVFDAPSPLPRPDRAPAAVVHAPAGVGPRPWVVVFFHGWRGCARALVRAGPTPCLSPGSTDGSEPGADDPAAEPEDGWGLGAAHDAAGLDSVLVVPQLAWRARETTAGDLDRRGFAEEMLARVLRKGLGDELGPAFGLDAARGITVMAHSAGYEAAAALLESGLGPRVTDVVLFDALYGRMDELEGWLRGDEGRRLVSYYASDGTPWKNGRRLLRRLRHRLGRDRTGWVRRGPLGADDLDGVRYALVRAGDRHADVPRARTGEALRALAAARREGGDGAAPRTRPPLSNGGEPADTEPVRDAPGAPAGARPPAHPRSSPPGEAPRGSTPDAVGG